MNKDPTPTAIIWCAGPNCNNTFKGKGNQKYCSPECAKAAAKENRNAANRLKANARKRYNAGINAPGNNVAEVDHYRATRDIQRYPNATDAAAAGMLELVPDSYAITRTKSSPQTIESEDDDTRIDTRGDVIDHGKNWGAVRKDCSRYLGGLGPKPGHCPSCNLVFKDAERHTEAAWLALPHFPSYVTAKPSKKPWKPMRMTPEPTEPMTKADIDATGETHRAGCVCDECGRRNKRKAKKGRKRPDIVLPAIGAMPFYLCAHTIRGENKLGWLCR